MAVQFFVDFDEIGLSRDIIWLVDYEIISLSKIYLINHQTNKNIIV